MTGSSIGTAAVSLCLEGAASTVALAELRAFGLASTTGANVGVAGVFDVRSLVGGSCELSAVVVTKIC